MKLRPVSAAILLLLSSLTLAAHADDIRRPYIIQLTDKPVASYTGDVAGLNATQPPAGERLNLDSGDVQLYSDYLGQKQATVQAAVAGAPITHTYSVVLNGFAAMLTDAEVQALQLRSDVATISADVPRQMLTSYTPSFLGLDKPDGLWSKLGGKAGAGENVIIGIVDGGVWPENPAYADRVDANGKPTFDNSGTVVYSAPPSRWKGICQTGQGFTVANCNNKLIGAQYFDSVYLSQSKTTDWTEFKSPRDSLGNAGWGGHGTHTSSTAGGNADVAVTVGGVGLGNVSGMAPRARLAMYKVCWSYLDAAEANGVRNGCYNGDSVAAIEKAVLDGVHVINFSIGGSSTSVTDPVEVAFFNASNAGVFVAASAGNSGPNNTVAHISPWIATVAASTHNRTYVGDATLGSGAVLTGASNNANTPSTPMIQAKDAGKEGVNAANLALCFGAADGVGELLDPAKVTGKILVCDRGSNVLVNKSAAGKAAGAVGVVITNVAETNNTTIVQGHSISTVHVTVANGTALKNYMAANPGTATVALGNVRSITDTTVTAPQITSFSSRGPNMFDPNVLKPDLTAPGADILAGHSPNQTQAQWNNIVNGSLSPMADWAALQGTSMSSPHVAGLAALLRQQYPSWTPAAIKSALMTTGYNTMPETFGAGDLAGVLPFGQGAGHVNPNGASDPGLIYNATQVDYNKYMCGVGITSKCGSGTIAAYNLNMPSIAVSNVLGTTVVTRSVTNVGATAATYTGTLAVPGYSAVLNPTSLTLGVGETKSFTVALTRTSSPLNKWQYGSLSWSDGAGHIVRSPVVARSGAQVVAPSLFTSNRAALSKVISVTTGFSGKMNTIYGGLKEIGRSAHNVTQAAPGAIDTSTLLGALCRAGGAGVRAVPVTVPAGSLFAQFELFNRDTSSGNGNDDLDMALLNPAGTVIAYSGNGGSNEVMRMSNPAAGTYTVCVGAYESANGTSTDFTLSSAVVTSADRFGNFRVLVPATVYAGGTASVNVSWSGLPAGKRYIGGMQLLDGAGAVATTTGFVVETNNPVPLSEPAMRAPRPEAY
jgi:subtilisin family serine protease